jgi:hypothetical protein
MKKLVLTILFVFALSSVGLAAPLMDYSKGSVQFDYTYRPNLDMNGTLELTGVDNIWEGGSFNESISRSFDGSANMDAGLTIGLGNNWAVQYRQYNPEGTIWSYSDEFISVGLDGKIKAEEFNVLYKFGPKFAGFVGAVRSNASIKASLSGYGIGTSIPEIKAEEHSTVQVGLLGTATVAKNLDAYGIVSFGSDYRNWEAGLSYNFDKNWSLNVSYRDTQFDKYKLAGISDSYSGSYADVNLKDITVKGWGFGLAYKF